jgi:hypothetical protein
MRISVDLAITHVNLSHDMCGYPVVVSIVIADAFDQNASKIIVHAFQNTHKPILARCHVDQDQPRGWA